MYKIYNWLQMQIRWLNGRDCVRTISRLPENWADLPIHHPQRECET